jgi:hypothetical protein
MATDMQDGGVASAGLVWTYQIGSNAPVKIGTGPLLTKTDLPIGANIVTLTATDSVGLSAATSITVNVTDDDRPLGPTLTVAPPELGFGTVGQPAVMTATLSVGNMGSGQVHWSVRSDQPWLTASPASGTAPSKIVVSANPASLPTSTIANGNLILTAPGPDVGATQTVTVPVTIYTLANDLQSHPIVLNPPAVPMSGVFIPAGANAYKASW